MKKAWKKPQLVVVVRGSVEENVLNKCKTVTEGVGVCMTFGIDIGTVT